MYKPPLTKLVVGLVLFFVATACANSTGQNESAPTLGTAAITDLEQSFDTAPDDGGGVGQEEPGGTNQRGGAAEPVTLEEGVEDFESAVFDDPTTVDNPFFPLVPGTRHVYEGTALEDDEVIQRKIIFIVTDLTKEINGVETVVVWERDFDDDALVESEIVFFAQANDGAVWHFGQYYEIWEEGEFVGGRIWLVDLPEGARAGIIMPGDPQPGTASYSQGWAPPPFNWADRATVAEMGAETCTVNDCFNGVLITEESDEKHPGAFQLKFYAPGVGNVQVGWRGPDPEEEELDLVEDVLLNQAELAGGGWVVAGEAAVSS